MSPSPYTHIPPCKHMHIYMYTFKDPRERPEVPLWKLPLLLCASSKGQGTQNPHRPKDKPSGSRDCPVRHTSELDQGTSEWLYHFLGNNAPQIRLAGHVSRTIPARGCPQYRPTTVVSASVPASNSIVEEREMRENIPGPHNL